MIVEEALSKPLGYIGLEDVCWIHVAGSEKSFRWMLPLGQELRLDWLARCVGLGSDRLSAGGSVPSIV
jgi:hypothetical protein